MHIAIKKGYKSIYDTLEPIFLGRSINQEFIAELESLNVDTCGENGVYHTLVIDTLIFTKITIDVVGKEKSSNYNLVTIVIS